MAVVAEEKKERKKKKKGKLQILTQSTLCQREFCRYIHIPLTKG